MAKAPTSDKKSKGAGKVKGDKKLKGAKKSKAEAKADMKLARAAAKEDKRAISAAKGERGNATPKTKSAASAADGRAKTKAEKGAKKAGRSAGDPVAPRVVTAGAMRLPRQAGAKDGAASGRRAAASGPAVPLDGYDSLTVAQVRAQLPGLDRDALQQVHDYEAAAKGRVTLLAALRTALSH
jgi:hypothetical protein